MSACRLLIWCLIELDAAFVVAPGMEGSSGTETRNLSSFFLNVSKGHPLKFLNSLGRELNKIGPRVDRKLCRIVCKATDVPVIRAFTKHNLPSLG